MMLARFLRLPRLGLATYSRNSVKQLCSTSQASEEVQAKQKLQEKRVQILTEIREAEKRFIETFNKDYVSKSENRENKALLAGLEKALQSYHVLITEIELEHEKLSEETLQRSQKAERLQYFHLLISILGFSILFKKILSEEDFEKLSFLNSYHIKFGDLKKKRQDTQTQIKAVENKIKVLEEVANKQIDLLPTKHMRICSAKQYVEQQENAKIAAVKAITVLQMELKDLKWKEREMDEQIMLMTETCWN
ncbi:hypothetical protein L596_021865 [Steinernema carpocapsae]|uniref:Uncharacterized protein n=1 Tax=Steinernema carpocapsae TaxID=34508 RepID=A0A4V6A017_STECR|nr:hypothetical protein L596_021865 [Steinernema carpocapsae]